MLCRRLIPGICVGFIGISFLACSRTDRALPDTTQAAMGPPADTGMAAMPAMDRTPAKDADQEFVRMMVDHHQGLIALADTALSKNPSEHIRADATEMKQKQGAEQQMMIAMLKSDYGEDKVPMIMPNNADMISKVASTSGTGLDRVFREQVIAHHEEALKIISDYESKLTKPPVQAMAAGMKSDQQKEIAELKSELRKI